MHYKTFSEAEQKWKERMSRIDNDNLCVMFTNWQGDMDIARRFDALPFKQKVLFTPVDLPEIRCAYTIKNWNTSITLHRVCNWYGKRYIDQFDYVSFINDILR